MGYESSRWVWYSDLQSSRKGRIWGDPANFRSQEKISYLPIQIFLLHDQRFQEDGGESWSRKEDMRKIWFLPAIVCLKWTMREMQFFEERVNETSPLTFVSWMVSTWNDAMRLPLQSDSKPMFRISHWPKIRVHWKFPKTIIVHQALINCRVKC